MRGGEGRGGWGGGGSPDALLGAVQHVHEGLHLTLEVQRDCGVVERRLSKAGLAQVRVREQGAGEERPGVSTHSLGAGPRVACEHAALSWG
jgi:hypothetical protein